MNRTLPELLCDAAQSARIDRDISMEEDEALNALAEILGRSDIAEVSELEDFIAKYNPPIISP